MKGKSLADRPLGPHAVGAQWWLTCLWDCKEDLTLHFCSDTGWSVPRPPLHPPGAQRGVTYTQWRPWWETSQWRWRPKWSWQEWTPGQWVFRSHTLESIQQTLFALLAWLLDCKHQKTDSLRLPVRCEKLSKPGTWIKDPGLSTGDGKHVKLGISKSSLPTEASWGGQSGQSWWVDSTAWGWWNFWLRVGDW